MNKILTLMGLLAFVACTTPEKNSVAPPQVKVPEQIERTSFQTILDSAQVGGTILVYDLQGDTYFSNDFNATNQGHLPASTYKITNSIIALETGVVASDSTLFEWDGTPRRLPIWEQDLVFRDAFHYSCVPCYQEVARTIGADRMNHYLTKLNYGSMVVDSLSIDTFWLVGDSKISPAEQLAFLIRFYHAKLPISERTFTIMKRMMVIEKTPNYTISGKTGWSIRNGNNNGWFVGYAEVAENTFFIAVNIAPKAEFEMDMFSTIRKKIAYKALNDLGALHYDK